MANIEKLTLKKKKNDYDEFSIIAWKNGKKYEAGTYYTDDWEDAVGTLKQMAKQMSLTIRPNGTGYVADSKVKDLYNKWEHETDKEFLKEAIKEMKRYEGNWSGMKSTEKRNIAPGGIKELKQNIVWAEQRLKQLQSGVKDAISYSTVFRETDDIDGALRLTEIDMKVVRDYMDLEELDSNPKATYYMKHYLDLIKKNCDRAIAATNRLDDKIKKLKG